jgi:hypothetical protein
MSQPKVQQSDGVAASLGTLGWDILGTAVTSRRLHGNARAEGIRETTNARGPIGFQLCSIARWEGPQPVAMPKQPPSKTLAMLRRPLPETVANPEQGTACRTMCRAARQRRPAWDIDFWDNKLLSH